MSVLTAPATAPAASCAAGAGHGPRGYGARSRLALALATVLGLALTLLTPARPAAAAFYGHSRTPYESSIAWAVQRQINAERAAHGLPRMYMDWHLQLSAHRHDVQMAHYNVLSHQLPGEAFFATRIRIAGYPWVWAGENIAWNSQISTAGVLMLQSLMYNEKAPYDGHRRNILSPYLHNVGVDVYIDRVHGKVWLTTDFGSRTR